MKRLVKATKDIVRNAKPKPKVEGFVELLTHDKFEGWAIHRELKPLTIKLKIKGEEFLVAPQWFQRDDVMAVHGQAHRSAGFSAQWPDKVRNILATEKINAVDLKIEAGSTELKVTGPLPVPVELLSPLSQDALGATLKNKSKISPRSEALFVLNNSDGEVVAAIDSFDKFSIQGHYVSYQQKKPELKIYDGQGFQEWPLLWQTEQDDLELGTPPARILHRFEVEVPGYAWERAAGTKAEEIEIILSAEGFEAFPPLTLSREKALQWLHQISILTDDRQQQYYSLVAIEHLRFSGLSESLDPRSAVFYQRFAEKMQLEDFLQAGRDCDESITPMFDYVDGYETQLLWKAQKALNQKIIRTPEKIFDSIMEVVRDQKLIGSVKQNFLQSLVPLLAKNKQLFQLKQLIDFREFYALDHSDDAWAVSLATAPLVADKQIGRATDALWRLAKMLDKGWLNTECIWFVVQHIQTLEEQGEASHAEAEKVRYAVIGLLDGMDGEWFSRIHDAMLQQAVVEMLSKRYLMTDYQLRDVINAAIRHYALSPDFWAKANASGVSVLVNSIFQRARNHWLVVEAAFLDTRNLFSQWREVQSALNFFERQGNREAVYIRRELIATLLSDPKMEQEELLQLIHETVADDPMEAVRYAAHPMIEESTAARLLDAYRTEIPEALRLNTERASSVTYQAQLAAAEQLSKGEVNPQSLISLHNWSAMFLSVDMLASAIAKAPTAAENHLPLLDYYVQQVVAQSDSKYWLPAPVCTALANLCQLASQNKQLDGWLGQIKALLSVKFGEKHDALFERTPELAVQSQLLSPGWPQDTLVVIYSCRAYLETRINAIRKTWLTDLKARNIPYVILVGDGEDKLNGDVLELNVSDTYEDLPQKTLKLFDWVYHNTSAQYVLKIDDDCYLDVNRYFNCLAYRKHHYYGRVIHRTVGGMDRAWHHSKSKTERARKAIDKSPEPSMYADGGGGYTLSRIAMQNLLNAAGSARGERLIINSFMEDKLVGDLLALRHIHPNNEDYECYQRRRTFGAATPVGMWENIFYPSLMTPTQVTHLDTDKDQAKVQALMQQAQLWPKKIWQSCWSTNIQLNSNQLELITDLDKACRVLTQNLCVIAVMRNEMIMLPHFLSHYRKLGVKSFIITDNCSDDGTREYLLKEPDVLLYSADTEYKHSHYGVAWQQAMLANHCVGKWALIADADELLVYPNHTELSLEDYVKDIDSRGFTCVRTDMVDMYPQGDLSSADFQINEPFEVAGWHDKEPLKEWSLGSGWFSNSKNWASSLRHRIDKNAEPNAFVSQKYALIKYQPWMRFSQGLHYGANICLQDQSVIFAHFKYHAAFKNKVQDEIKRKQHYDGAKEYRRYLTMLSEVSSVFFSDRKSKLLEVKNEV